MSQAALPRLVYSKQDLEGLGLDAISKPRAQLSVVKAAAVEGGLPPEMSKVCKDGERTKHLTSLAGKLIGQQRPLEEVIRLTNEWNQDNTPPLDDEKVEATCHSIWKTHERNHPSGGIEDALTPLFDINDAKVSRFLAEEPPKRRWLLETCLPYGKVGAIVATGGTGKSQFLLQIGVSVATGVDFLHWRVTEPGGVLILAAEDDTDELHRRLRNIHLAFAVSRDADPSFTTRLQKNLYIKSMVAEDNMMTRVSSGAREISVTQYVERLVLTARRIENLKLIVIDPASRFRGGDENAAQDTTRFIEALERVREQTGATVLVAHHTNKGSMNSDEASQNAQRGSAAFSDGIRWQMNLATMTSNDAKKLGIPEAMRRRYLKAAVVKNNYGPPAEDVVLHRNENGCLEKVTIERIGSASDDALLATVRDLIKSEAAAGRSHSATAFEKEFGGESGPMKLGKVALRGKLREWIRSKMLTVNGKKQLESDPSMPSGSGGSSYI